MLQMVDLKPGDVLVVDLLNKNVVGIVVEKLDAPYLWLFVVDFAGVGRICANFNVPSDMLDDDELEAGGFKEGDLVMNSQLPSEYDVNLPDDGFVDVFNETLFKATKVDEKKGPNR